LQAAADPRATPILKTAHDLLQSQATQLPDPAARRTFFKQVTAHREIVDAWSRTGQSFLNW
jgi:hypothetical protein